MSPNEYHAVPVPAEDLEAVFLLLAYRARDRNAIANGALPEVPTDQTQAKDDAWTDEMLERVARGDTISTQVLSDIMDVIVRDPRDAHAYNREELVEETGHSAGRITATFTKLTPHFRKHYGTDWWPVVVDSGASFDPQRPGTYYSMTPALTERWKRIRNL